MADQPRAARRGSWRRAGRVAWTLLATIPVLLACGRTAPRPPVALVPPGGAAGWDATRCAAPAADVADPRDADGDRLDDGCELALARAFAPALIVDPTDCLWLADARPARLAGGYLFAARPRGYDACDRNTAVVRFPVVSAAQNIGSRAHPTPSPDGCLPASALPLGPSGLDPTARECLWDPTRPFRGWQPDTRGRGPTSYGRSLAEVADF